MMLELDRVSGKHASIPKEILYRVKKLRISGSLDELSHGIKLLKPDDAPQCKWSTRGAAVAAVGLEIVHCTTRGEEYEEIDISPALGTSLCDLRLEGIRLAPRSQPGQLSTLVIQDVALTIKEVRHIIVGARVRHLVLRNIQVPLGLNIYDLEHLERARKNDRDSNPCARLETLHIKGPSQEKSFHNNRREPMIDYSSFFSDILTPHTMASLKKVTLSDLPLSAWLGLTMLFRHGSHSLLSIPHDAKRVKIKDVSMAETLSLRRVRLNPPKGCEKVDFRLLEKAFSGSKGSKH
ncbi:hypothetical protein BKA70DRAFT_1436900 [Coprinopsis sp. MPI-PUGE-AT-0042]|nr:hypothetical protein BKA70DRAFT_1436900 [Coprinopsis sp. MPI-PUGE-AT-0042]